MATLPQIDVMQEGALVGLPMPLTVRPSFAMSDEELIAFSRRNEPYRIERNAAGELEIMTPPGLQGSHFEAVVIGSYRNGQMSTAVCTSAPTPASTCRMDPCGNRTRRGCPTLIGLP